MTFTLTPQHLQLYDRSNQWVVESGRFTVWVGASSEDLRLEGSFVLGDGAVEEGPTVPTERVDPR